MVVHHQHEIRLEPIDHSEQMFEVDCSRLISMAERYSISLTYEQSAMCLRHLLYVDQINEYINLTSITSLDEGIILHILDSLLFTLPIKGVHTSASFLDMGSGAGFPGIPFHLVTKCPGILLDSVQKKVDVVNMIVDELQLDDVEAVHNRLEIYAADEQNRFDFVLARALASLPTLIEYAAPFLKDDGQLIVSKGVPSSEELASGDNAAKICGLVQSDLLHLSLPDSKGKRTIIVYERVGKPSIQLPRAVGMAKKHPLS